MSVSIRTMQPDDWPAVSAIYAEGIISRRATFETSVPSWEVWDQSHNNECRLVANRKKGVIGWAALSPVSSRDVYRGVADISIYVAVNSQRQGIGRNLMDALFAVSEEHGFWTLQAGILSYNGASIAFHEACGFRIVGTREKIGMLDGVWRNTVLMERRSTVVGVE
jgi:L-amino acid N-acyltransferase YncA